LIDFQSRSTNTLSRQQPLFNADGNVGRLQKVRERCAGELTALIGIEDHGLALAQQRLLVSSSSSP